MTEEYVKSIGKLNFSEKKLIRACPSCEGEMKPAEKVIENSVFFFRENGILFNCENCDEAVVLLSYPTIFTKFLTFLISIGIIVAIVMNNYTGLVKELLNESIGMSALAILISGIALILIFGGLFNIISLTTTIRKAAKYPLISGGSILRIIFLFIITMMYGFLPWIILGGLGFLNDTVMHIDRDWAIFLIIPGFTPIFVANKVGISVQGAFFATASYPTMGLIAYFFI